MLKIAIIKREKGKYKLYSKKKNPKTKKRRNLGVFDTLAGAKKREKQIFFFKSQHADDGADEDNEDRIYSKLSDIAAYLEASGFIDEADELYDAIDIKEDDCGDEFLANGREFTDGRLDNNDNPSFGIPGAMASLANKCDELGLYKIADLLDSQMAEIIERLEEENQIEPEEVVLKDEEAVANSNCKGSTSFENSPGSAGISDAYFYRGSGSVENNI
jgi:hypothetical protein